jgi:hypothetical protein
MSHECVLFEIEDIKTVEVRDLLWGEERGIAGTNMHIFASITKC